MPDPLQCPECGAALTPGQLQAPCPRCALKGALEISNDNTELVLPSPEAGERIGRYKLLEKIGEGGCGIVYMAEQEAPVRRRVALKVIKLGMDTKEVVARFEAERQALALMDHPHIAKVFDGGATETGRPYFVMELVRGLRITDYCDQKNLPTRQRLDLFIQVCQAVQHAHQKGIIHRDLKPSNILVTVNDGVPVPKVIDFGIAKATGQQLTDKTIFTKFHQFLGSPAYTSPEQAEMTSLDIDTRSDIYSLGVLLYELLTGRLPFESKELLAVGFDEMLRTIREKEPARPSARISTLAAAEQTTVAQQRQTDAPRLVHLIRGDLDWIVMKCLEKDRARRYETANGLAADVHRHLSNEPVLARPPGNLYRFQKTVRRHKLAFAAASAVLVSLILGLGATIVMFLKEQAALGGEKAARAQVVQQKSEVELKKAELERKNAEFRAMLVEAARSDRLVAEDKLRAGQEQGAFAHLARACEYDPSSTLAAEMALGALGSWSHSLPAAVLTGHAKGVKSAKFSPDGTRIVTASFDKTAVVWDAATGRMLVRLAGHTGEVTSAEYSPDGTRILTGSYDKTARVWDPTTGETLMILKGHSNAVTRAHFSADSLRIITVLTGEKTARVWDAHSGNGLVTLAGEQEPGIWMMAQFSPDGSRIVTAGVTNAILWDAATGKLLATLIGHTGDVRSARFDGNGSRIITASWDGTARVWDVATGKALVALVGHERQDYGVENAEFSPDGTRIVTAGRGDKTMRIWEAGTGKLLRTIAGHEGAVSIAHFSPDGDRVLSVSHTKSGGTARIWDAATGKLLDTLSGHQAGVLTAHFSSDGRRIVTASSDQTARIWNSSSSRTHDTLANTTRAVTGARFTTDGTRIVATSWHGRVRVWQAATGDLIATLQGFNGFAESVPVILENGRILIVSWSGSDRTARVWDASTGKLLATLDGHTAGLSNAQFSPDGKRVVTTSYDRTARVWSTSTGQTLATLAGDWEKMESAQFSPGGGTRVITATGDRIVRVWDAATGKLLVALVGHKNRLFGAYFSPDGGRVVTGSFDGTARVWDLASGATLAVIVGDWESPATLNSDIFIDHQMVQFTPDGKRIISTTGGSNAQIWDATNGQRLMALVGHDGKVKSAQYNPDGTRIVTASLDKTARIWDATTGKPVATLAGHETGLLGAQFSPDGTHIITFADDLTGHLWDALPNRVGPPPNWVPDFLRYMAQMRLNPDGELETLKAADWLALRERLRGVLRASASTDTPYLRILRKYVRE